MSHARNHHAPFGFATLDPSRPATISINTTSGNITVIPVAEDDAVHVTTNDDDDAGFDIATDGNEILVNNNIQIGSRFKDVPRQLREHLQHGVNGGHFDSARFFNLKRGSSDLHVEIPRNLHKDSRLVLRTHSGDVEVHEIGFPVITLTQSGDQTYHGISGYADLTSMSGDIHIDRMEGRLKIVSTNGDVRVREVNGPVEINTTSGDIEIADGEVPSLQAKSTSGDVRITARMYHNTDYVMKSISGDVRLDARIPVSGARLTMRTISGDKIAEGPWMRAETTAGSAAANVPRMSLASTSGDLHAKARADGDVIEARPADDAAATGPLPNASKDGNSWVFDFDLPDPLAGWEGPTERLTELSSKISEAVNSAMGAIFTPEPVPPRETTEERRMRLLQAVERGEITVDEALRQLDQE